MDAILGANAISYARGMGKPPKAGRLGAGRRGARPAPNRIKELARAAELSFDQVAAAAGVHRVTISRLATGAQELTHDWMKSLAPILNTTPAGIIEEPPAATRRVPVTGELAAGAWRENVELPAGHFPDVLITDDPALRRLQLYAARVRGDSMNLRYADGSIVVMSRLVARAEIQPGHRYHVRRTRPDGLVEHTIKALAIDERRRYWLKPESTDPEHQEWIPLDARGAAGGAVEILGRVRIAVQREG